MQPDFDSPAIHRVEVTIVVALAIEATPLVAAMSDRVKLTASDGRRIVVGRLGGRPVAVVTAGVGKQASLSGVKLALAGHRPGLVIAAGLCGGLAPDLRQGDVITAEAVLGPDGDVLAPHDPATLVNTESLRRVRLVTSGRVADTPDAKRSLHEATGAHVVDMESWWIATAAEEAAMPWCVIRAVSDTAVDGIPNDVAALAATRHPARMAGAAVRLLFRRPAAIADMAQLREQACVAAEALADRLQVVLASTP